MVFFIVLAHYLIILLESIKNVNIFYKNRWCWIC